MDEELLLSPLKAAVTIIVDCCVWRSCRVSNSKLPLALTNFMQSGIFRGTRALYLHDRAHSSTTTSYGCSSTHTTRHSTCISSQTWTSSTQQTAICVPSRFESTEATFSQSLPMPNDSGSMAAQQPVTKTRRKVFLAGLA